MYSSLIALSCFAFLSVMKSPQMWPLRFTQQCNGAKIQMGEKKNAARANRSERGGSRERESEMGNFLLVWKMFLILGLTFNRPAEDLPSQDG